MNQPKTAPQQGTPFKFATESQATKLELNVMGSFAATIGQQSLSSLGSRKALALFVYLTMTNKPVTRNALTSLFWPEMSEKAAKNNLRTTLTMLKQALGSYLAITIADVTFNRQLPYQLDIEDLSKRLDAAYAVRDPQALQEALGLYQGEFLQGFQLRETEPFEEWLLLQREQLHLRVIHALETIMALAIEQNQSDVGIRAGQELLTMEPWSEVAHRQLMALFIMSGQRSRALVQYKTCCRLLAEELGVEPMAETTALYQQIQAGELREANVIPKAAVVVSPSELSAAPRRAIGLQPSTPHSPTPTAVPNNLFATLSAFIGRQTELAHLAELLTVKKCRLLTIFGPGGVGKSSLALALGQRLLRTAPASFPDGIFFVPLSGVEIDPSTAEQDPDNRIDGYPILTAIAEAIGYRFQGGRPVQAQLIDYLQHRRLLLVLDNFEQLVTCANILVNVLTHTQATSILVTSRIRLNIRGETTVILKGLSLVSTTDSSSIDGLPIAPAHAPNTAEQTSDAVALFVDRAKNLNPNFTVDADTLNPIIRICQTVIGLPLAIEMTAAWTTLYSCAEIAERLTQEDQQVNLLTSQFQDQPARQQNLQKVFEDSWALLPTQVQWALAKVGVFSGQFTSAAALAIADLTPANLLLLRDHSMMQVDDEHHCSLHPLMRQFAAQKWQELTTQQPDAREHLRNVHSNYYLQLLADLVEHHSGKAEFVAIHSLKKAHAEIVRSWQWAMQHHGWTLISNSMVGLLRYLELTNQSIDGKALFGMAEITENDPVAQWLQVAQCHFCRRLTEFDEARDRLMAILAILPPTTVEEEMANAPLPTDAVGKLALRTRTFALCVLGWIDYAQGHYEIAQSGFSTAYALAERIGDVAHLMEACNGLGAVAFSLKRYASARNHYEDALRHAKQQDDLHYTAIILGNLAAHAQVMKMFPEAERYLQMRLTIDHQTHNTRQMAISYQRLGQLALIGDAYARAESHLRQSLTLFVQLGNSPEIAHVLLDLSKSLLCQQQTGEAERQCLRSLQLAIQGQMTPRILAALALLAEIRIAEEKKEDAITLLKMVNRSAQIPAATWRKVQRLQDTLSAELGEKFVEQVQPAPAAQSLQEFGAQLLLQSDQTNNHNGPPQLAPQ